VTAWAPHTQRNINKLEGIQHQTARFVMSDFSAYSSVSTMLSNEVLSTLHHRRYILKLMHGFFKDLKQFSQVTFTKLYKS